MIILSYWDHSLYDPCCIAENKAQESLREMNPDGKVSDADAEMAAAFVSACMPKCDEYYNVRMPHWFYTTNLVIGFTFLVEYCLHLYIA
jgi:hypothetical protein